MLRMLGIHLKPKMDLKFCDSVILPSPQKFNKMKPEQDGIDFLPNIHSQEKQVQERFGIRTAVTS